MLKRGGTYQDIVDQSRWEIPEYYNIAVGPHRSGLAAHEYPREIEFVDSLPMTTTGKMMRGDLRKLEEERRRHGP